MRLTQARSLLNILLSPEAAALLVAAVAQAATAPLSSEKAREGALRQKACLT